jgi:hypothetical protein
MLQCVFSVREVCGYINSTVYNEIVNDSMRIAYFMRLLALCALVYCNRWLGGDL